VQQAAFTSASPAGLATSADVFFVSKNLVSAAQPWPRPCEITHAAAKALHFLGGTTGVTQHCSRYLAWVRDLPSVPSGGALFVPTRIWPEAHVKPTQSLHFACANGVQQAAFTSASPCGPATSTAVFFVSKNLVSAAQPVPATCLISHAAE